MTIPYHEASPQQLRAELTDLATEFQKLKKKGLNLDLTRGKPSPEQLELSSALLTIDITKADLEDYGIDVRNYGGLDGFAQAKALFSHLVDAPAEQTLLGGNSSLALMHDTIVRNLFFGNSDSQKPWQASSPVAFLCPVPGYDRHFAILEHYGIKMIPVAMTDEGPDLAQVEKLVAEDSRIKGMWCVPKYSNPTGTTYSEATVKRLAAMNCAAEDFRIFWDNAYSVHFLDKEPAPLLSILRACADAGNPNRPYVFASTSKITFAGAGVAVMAASPANIADIHRHLKIQTIGPDKINIARHLKFFKNAEGIKAHMARHARLIEPKFEAVSRVLAEDLAPCGVAQWTKPVGGYFISLDTMPGIARKAIAMAAEIGIKLTPAGSTYPYHDDPEDTNIRIAPTFPGVDDVEAAISGVCLCIRLASIEKMLGSGS